MGKEAVEEGKKGPVTYARSGIAPNGIPPARSENQDPTPTKQAKKTGLNSKAKAAVAKTSEFKFEGGKFKGNFLVHANIGQRIPVDRRSKKNAPEGKNVI